MMASCFFVKGRGEMVQNENQEHAVPRHDGWISAFLLLLGVIIVGGVLAWQVARHTLDSGGGPSSTGSSPPIGISSPLTPPIPLTAVYDETAKEGVAQGLHLTVAQVTAKLQADPVADLEKEAKPQGLAQDQLYALIVNALQIAGDHMVSTGVWTQPQANEEMQFWKNQNPQSLITEITSWFRQ
jgi:hypothetical protein